MGVCFLCQKIINTDFGGEKNVQIDSQDRELTCSSDGTKKKCTGAFKQEKESKSRLDPP